MIYISALWRLSYPLELLPCFAPPQCMDHHSSPSLKGRIDVWSEDGMKVAVASLTLLFPWKD